MESDVGVSVPNAIPTSKDKPDVKNYFLTFSSMRIDHASRMRARSSSTVGVQIRDLKGLEVRKIGPLSVTVVISNCFVYRLLGSETGKALKAKNWNLEIVTVVSEPRLSEQPSGYHSVSTVAAFCWLTALGLFLFTQQFLFIAVDFVNLLLCCYNCCCRISCVGFWVIVLFSFIIAVLFLCSVSGIFENPKPKPGWGPRDSQYL
ncbi:hypothetical protein M9H77_16865 [Catharanthus roseus]|uniref:Uncharacterized protein n=1 Tax=Catharanthus roseus TaxID=4058 RepID=A0ACC0B354_CATRO|nr:hypothetical protein M9H77_16865 [Catharanthus roseus]